MRRVGPPILRPFSRLSWFGLIAALFYLSVLMPVWLMTGIAWASPYGPPTGLIVHLRLPTGPRIPGIQPLLVHVQSPTAGVRPNLFVDAGPVAWEDFDRVLRKEVALRPPDWPVYIEGDREMDWGSAVKAIDEIRGVGAQVVLLSPNSRNGSR